MNGHNVHLVECAGTGRAFSHAVADAVVDALVTEEMATSLERRILKVVATNGAQGKGLSSGLVGR